MMENEFVYLYPPRPEFAIPPVALGRYDNGKYVAQPKLNGSCCVLEIRPGEVRAYNRHKEVLTGFRLPSIDALYRGTGGWLVLAGEYMNKGKKGRHGELFNHKFVIFDILTYDGELMAGGPNIKERIGLIEAIYPSQERYDRCLIEILPDIYRVDSFYCEFEKMYLDLVTVDMYEGLVIKRRDAVLEPLVREKNNTGWQVKCRKPT